MTDTAADAVMRSIRKRHPGFRTAVAADARFFAGRRGERTEFRSRLDTLVQILRMLWVSDAFIGLLLYRAKASLQARGVPILPTVAHKLAIATSGVSIGDPVVIAPGLYLPHGHVVIDGLVEIGRGVAIRPFVTIGLREGHMLGPTIGPRVMIGTGAKLIGPIKVGRASRVGANAVVVDDVPPGASVKGVPAR